MGNGRLGISGNGL